jgi:hypothetical protein
MAKRKCAEFVMDPEARVLFYNKECQRTVMMTPNRFRYLTAETTFAEESLKRLIERMENGLPIDPPFLDIAADTCQVLGHEGRHRAEAARKLGLEKIPVLMFCKKLTPDPMWKGEKFYRSSSIKNCSKCLKDKGAGIFLDLKPQWIYEQYAEEERGKKRKSGITIF